MSKFEDTRLLKHPTVKKAFAERLKFFQEGDNFVAEAVRAGEIISQHAKTPDPDAVGAVLRQRMVAVIDATDKFMCKPAQMKIRKPCSPDIEPAW